jgi:hypothetical protein
LDLPNRPTYVNLNLNIMPKRRASHAAAEGRKAKTQQGEDFAPINSSIEVDQEAQTASTDEPRDNVKSSPAKKTGLLGLPVEIRRQVFGYILFDKWTIIPMIKSHGTRLGRSAKLTRRNAKTDSGQV